MFKWIYVTTPNVQPRGFSFAILWFKLNIPCIYIWCTWKLHPRVVNKSNPNPNQSRENALVRPIPFALYMNQGPRSLWSVPPPFDIKSHILQCQFWPSVLCSSVFGTYLNKKEIGMAEFSMEPTACVGWSTRRSIKFESGHFPVNTCIFILILWIFGSWRSQRNHFFSLTLVLQVKVFWWIWLNKRYCLKMHNEDSQIKYTPFSIKSAATTLGRTGQLKKVGSWF